MNTAVFPPAAPSGKGARLPALALGALMALAGLTACSTADERAADARTTQDDQRDTMSHGATEY